MIQAKGISNLAVLKVVSPNDIALPKYLLPKEIFYPTIFFTYLV
jgi:hypothetical protein